MGYTEKAMLELKKQIELSKANISKCDKEVNLIYHDIETRNFNAYEGFKLAEELQAVLQMRRVWKVKKKRVS